MFRALPHRLTTALLTLCLLAPGGASAALLSLVPDSSFATDGQSVAVDLVVSDLGDFAAPSIGAFSADVIFDIAALSFTDYALGGLLGDSGAFESADISTGANGGNVGLGEISFLLPGFLNADQPGSFVLATLNFTVLALGPGETTVLSVAPGALLSDALGFVLDTTATRGTITGSTPVPTPATLVLVLSAALAHQLARRRRHR